MKLSNQTTKEELAIILGVPVECLMEHEKTMKGFTLQFQFISVLRKNPLDNGMLHKLHNLSNGITYDYETRFNVANYSAEELKEIIKENLVTIKNYLVTTFVLTNISYEFDVYLVNQTTHLPEFKMS